MSETIQEILAISERINIKLQKIIDIFTDLNPKMIKLISDTKERNKILKLQEIQIEELAKGTKVKISR